MTRPRWFSSFVGSSIGCKMITAITGLLLLGFVVGHLLGNATVFFGRDALNTYAEKLKSLGVLLWIVRGGLIVVFITHVVSAVRLHNRNRFARPVPYACQTTVQASLASRYMIASGALILAYVIYHLMHFTFGFIGADAFASQEIVETAGSTVVRHRHDVYAMVIAGFKNPWIVLSYVIANAMLAWHLSHGVQSIAQSLGFHDARYTPLIQKVGLGVAAVIGAGYLSIPLSIFLGFVK